MTVPETAMNKDNPTSVEVGQVRRAGKAAAVAAVTYAFRPKQLPQQKFRFGASLPDSCHPVRGGGVGV